jgi:hypothetical protein
MTAEEKTPHPLAAYYKAKDEAWDDYCRLLTESALELMAGGDTPWDADALHRILFDYWDRTGQAEKIFSSYPRGQIEAAITRAWANEFGFWLNEYATDMAKFPARQKDWERLDKLDAAIGGANGERQARAFKNYDRYNAIADQIIKENPKLLANGYLTISLENLARRVRERLGANPPSVKTIKRALEEAFTNS